MAFELLPTNYTDAVWSGLRKYSQVNNSDGTVSFQDVTVYTEKENSFFGAKDANRMNQALNYIMSMLENGTDLYEEFEEYFTVQKSQFKQESDESYQSLTDYFADLKEKGDSDLATIEKNYEEHMVIYEASQNEAFDTWFESIKSKLGEDLAGSLQNQIDELNDRVDELENMIMSNNYYAPVGTNEGDVIVDTLGNTIIADWKLKEV